MPYQFQPAGAGSSLEQAISMFNNNFAKLDNEAVTKVFKGAGGVNAFTLGQIKDVGTGLILRDPDDVPRIACYIDSNGTPILKVSKDGFDVTTTGNENLIFNSAQNTLKVVSSGTVDLGIISAANIVAGGTQTHDLVHNLGFKPAVLAYADLPDANLLTTSLVQIPYTTFFTSGGLSGEFLSNTYYSHVDVNTIRFYVTHHTGTDYSPITPTWSIKYYLLQETAN